MTTVQNWRPFSGLEMQGEVNIGAARLLENISRAIRLGHPQVGRVPEKPDRIALVGSGPSLKSTEKELVDLVFSGAKLVTVNGAYHWCLARNLKPSAQIVLDARPANARFVQPEVSGCRYYVASQCAPETWDAVAGRPWVGIYHAIGQEPGVTELLDAYYLKRWMGIMGGTTVMTRAIGLLRLLGYLRMSIFGMDSCWLDGEHHAFDQPENDRDRPRRLRVAPSGSTDPADSKVFTVSLWQLKQAEDLLTMIQAAGDAFVLDVRGEGLIAHLLKTAADPHFTVVPEEA